MQINKIAPWFVACSAVLVLIFYIVGNSLISQSGEAEATVRESKISHTEPIATTSAVDVVATTSVQEVKDVSQFDTSSWKTLKTEQFSLQYPPNLEVIYEKSDTILEKRYFLKKSGVYYVELGVACFPDPVNSSRIYDDYSTYSQEKFRSALFLFNNFSDLFGSNPPVAAFSSGSNVLFAFEGGTYCDVGNCVGSPGRLYVAACNPGLNKRGNKALQCFTAETMNKLNELDRDEFLNGIISSVRFTPEFSLPLDCIGVTEVRG